jgi:outer membrane protein assembly factor BamB
VAVVLLGLGLGHGPTVPEQARGEQANATAAAISDAPSEAELNQNWPRFRGQGGTGVSESTNAPANWDPKTGAGIAWKTPVPAPGFNSPIIWKDRFFFSGGDASKREVFCYDCAKGQLIWRQAVANVPGSPSTAPEIPETTGYAASTMATDGRRVYVIFATGDVAALTLEGKLVWAKSFGPLKNPYGYASSLATWHDRLIVLLDQGEAEDGKSKLYALDDRTGQIVWQTPRKVGSSWASPITFEAAGKAQVVALSIPWAISYNLTDGSESWRVECLNGEVTPSPVFASGLVFVPSPSEKLLAIRPDGHGDVSKSHVAWSTEENVPDVTSPVSDGELIFTLTTPGLLTCFDVKTGKKLWEHDYEIECHSSPSIADGRVFIFGQKGAAIIVAAAREFKELFRTDMPDVFHASPAFADSMIIMRGTTNVWGIGKARK